MPGAIRRSADLPVGVRDAQDAGQYRLERGEATSSSGGRSARARGRPSCSRPPRSCGEEGPPAIPHHLSEPDREGRRSPSSAPVLASWPRWLLDRVLLDGAVADPGMPPPRRGLRGGRRVRHPGRHLLLLVDGHRSRRRRRLRPGPERARRRGVTGSWPAPGPPGCRHPRRTASRPAWSRPTSPKGPDAAVSGGRHRPDRRQSPGGRALSAPSSTPAGTRWPSDAWPVATAPSSARPASAATSPTPPTSRARSGATAPGHPASTWTTPTCRRTGALVGLVPVPSVAHPQALDLVGPVRHVGLRRLRALHRVVPGRHRPHRGGGGDRRDRRPRRAGSGLRGRSREDSGAGRPSLVASHPLLAGLPGEATCRGGRLRPQRRLRPGRAPAGRGRTGRHPVPRPPGPGGHRGASRRAAARW